jgi:molybdopterin synthase sulfur carrier subunit
MDVNFYATLRLITGKKTVSLDLPENVTVREMLEACFKIYPALRKELMNGDELHGHVHVFVNGRDVPYLEKTLETRITTRDKLDIFPAVGGG